MDVADPPEHEHRVHNGKRWLSLDELAGMQPGMDRLMAELPPRMHRLYYAAAAGNWPLALYYYRSVVKQLRLCAQSRPKYEETMADYLATDCPPVLQAIAGGDPAAFQPAYRRMVDRANELHAHFGKPYLVWQTPSTPPDDLDLAAGMQT